MMCVESVCLCVCCFFLMNDVCLFVFGGCSSLCCSAGRGAREAREENFARSSELSISRLATADLSISS